MYKKYNYISYYFSLFYYCVLMWCCILGANTTLLDSNSLTLLDHAMMDGFVPESTNSGELYVWGSNCNNSLGPQQSRSTPELLDIFHKMYPEELICKVVVEKFHSMIVTSLGKVFSCGHGQGGRLGLGTQQTVIIPEMVNFPETNHGEPITCTDVAISRDHSVFLCSDGNVSIAMFLHILPLAFN
jgi:alpha-tubulin suppressor-like RCC1 family protein